MDNINFIVNTLIYLLTIYLLAISFVGPLHMFQQNRYEVRRYIPWLMDQKSLIFNHTLILIGAIALLASQYNTLMAILFFVILVISIKIKSDQIKKQYIKPLVYTKRVKRQITTFVLLYLLSILIVRIWHDNSSFYTFSSVLITYIMIVFAYPLMIVVGALTIPIEKYVQYHYMQLAKKQLYSMTTLQKIGITGSYGKTSSKHILFDVLSNSFYTLMTPGSYNTPMGITLTIRNQLTKLHEVFIIEMGADKVGDITQLVTMNKPQYGIVTSIGPQHLNTFKTLENIINEKMQMIELLPADGIGFLNMDDENISNYHVRNNCKLVTYAIHKPADYQAINIQYNSNGSTFDILINGVATSFTTKLLGEHNIYNILSAVAVADMMDVKIAAIQKSVAALNYVPHRLELKKQNGITIIDNAFNSNPKSAKMSLEVLSKMPGYRVVCTPGMIDLGSMQKTANYEFGTQMIGKADFVILVGKQVTQPIYQGLEDLNYPVENILVVDHVREAFQYVYSLKRDDITLLLENDLPDAFSK